MHVACPEYRIMLYDSRVFNEFQYFHLWPPPLLLGVLSFSLCCLLFFWRMCENNNTSELKKWKPALLVIFRD